MIHRGEEKVLTSDLQAETKKMCHKYMLLLDLVSMESDPPKTKLKIATLAYFGLQREMLYHCFLRLKLQRAW